MDGPEKTEYTSLEQRMDSMIDAYLWFLPLPRFTYTLDKRTQNPTLNFLRSGVSAAMHHWNPDHKDHIDLKDLDDVVAFYKKYYKHLKALRDTCLSVDSHALLLILMILDPKELSTLSSHIAEDPDFHDIVFDIIDQEFKSTETPFVSSNNLMDLFDRVEKCLQKKNEIRQKHCEELKAQTIEEGIQSVLRNLPKLEGGIKYKSIDPSMIHEQLKINIQSKLTAIGKGYVSNEQLEDMLLIADLTEEDPKIGFV